jgi:hypothetical protein
MGGFLEPSHQHLGPIPFLSRLSQHGTLSPSKCLPASKEASPPQPLLRVAPLPWACTWLQQSGGGGKKLGQGRSFLGMPKLAGADLRDLIHLFSFLSVSVCLCALNLQSLSFSLSLSLSLSLSVSISLTVCVCISLYISLCVCVPISVCVCACMRVCVNVCQKKTG